jgi:hypothetical protein
VTTIYSEYPSAKWRKPLRSISNGACVEIAQINRDIGVRDSKKQESPALIYTRRTWGGFIQQIKQGELDSL